MEMEDVLDYRRSVRRYTGEAIGPDQLEQILRAGLLSPTSRGRRPWEFVVVQERAMLERLSHCREESARMLCGAACAIAVFASGEKSDVWTEDCAIAMSNMHLMAVCLGLGSCWIQGRLRRAEDGRTADAFCRELLGVPETYTLAAILSVGVPAVPPAPRALTPDWSRVHRERF